MPSEAGSSGARKATTALTESGLPDQREPAARLIVCEQTGAWAIALRREPAGVGLPVHETRGIAECWKVLAVAPASLVVVELTAATVEELLRRMLHLPRDFPRAKVVVVAERGLAQYEWLAREAGAVHFACSPRQAGTLVALARRHLEKTPLPQRTFAEQVWEGLPWATRRQSDSRE